MDDLEFTFKLLEKFFSQKRIQRTLDECWENDINDWEKWWQLELAMFINDHEEIQVWGMEEVFQVDARKNQGRSKNKQSMAVDLSFRRKGYKKGQFLYLELKQNFNTKTCISHMMKDWDKVMSGRSKSEYGDEIRELFLAGVHPQDLSKKEVTDLVEKHFEKHDIEGKVKVKAIPNTNFHLTLF